MSAILRVTLDVAVADLSPQERIECLTGGDTDADLPRLKDYLKDEDGASEIASVLRGLGEVSEELFGGSSIYVKFVSCKIISKEWRSSPHSRPNKTGAK